MVWGEAGGALGEPAVDMRGEGAGAGLLVGLDGAEGDAFGFGADLGGSPVGGGEDAGAADLAAGVVAPM